MKLISLIIIILLISSSVYSQNAVIENCRNNVLYYGIDNPIRATLIGKDCNTFFLTTTNGIIKGDNCNFVYRPNKIGNTIINFNKIDNGDTIIVQQKKFTIKKLPAPKAKLAGIINGDITSQKLIVQSGITTVLENFDICINIKVKTFRVIILRGNKLILNDINKGNEFNDKTKDELNKIRTGDFVYIISIVGLYPDGTEISTNSIELRIL